MFHWDKEKITKQDQPNQQVQSRQMQELLPRLRNYIADRYIGLPHDMQADSSLYTNVAPCQACDSSVSQAPCESIGSALWDSPEPTGQINHESATPQSIKRRPALPKASSNDLPKSSPKASRKASRLADLISRPEETFLERLYRFENERNMKDSDLYKKAHIDKRHFGKLKNGQIRPTKQVVIAFILALELNLDDAMDLLLSAGYTLSRSIKFDMAIEFFLKEEIYDTIAINEMLQDLGIELLTYY